VLQRRVAAVVALAEVLPERAEGGFAPPRVLGQSRLN
jgi:hypothetical protein